MSRECQINKKMLHISGRRLHYREKGKTFPLSLENLGERQMSRECQNSIIHLTRPLNRLYYTYKKEINLSFLGGLMTTIQHNFTALSADRLSIVGCHNLSSAVAYATGRLPNKVTKRTSYTYRATPYQAPSGQFYVMIHAGQQQVRLDVANVGTARYYAKNGVDSDVACEAYLSELSLQS